MKITNQSHNQSYPVKPWHRRLFSDYGPRALIFGASEGIGLAFAEELARSGFHLLLVARRNVVLKKAANSLTEQFHISVSTLSMDLSEPGAWTKTKQTLDEQDFGLVVYNAAASPIGAFLNSSLGSLQRTVSVNISAPLEILHGSGTLLQIRYAESSRRGGVILMSSLSGLRGTPYISAYAASKAWAMVLAEGVSRETRDSGLDVMACVAGATDTPGYRDSIIGDKAGMPVQSPQAVAREALKSLGRRNFVITGRTNRIIGWFIYNLIPRRWSSIILEKATSSLRKRQDAGLPFSDS